MNFKRFKSLLDREALYFCRVDKFRDPFEGTLTEPNKTIAGEVFKDLPDAYATLEKIPETNNRFSVVKCCAMNEQEPAWLWREYVNGYGLAIQSTFDQLTRCFNSEAEHNVFIGTVKYINHKTDRQYVRNMYYPLLYKSKNFDFEKELGAIVMKHSLEDDGLVHLD
jgi:hypothetical protein